VRNSDGTFAYVTVGGLNQVQVFRTDDFSRVTTIPVGKLPHGVWGSGDGTRVYVGLENDDRLVAINTLTNQVVATIPIGQAPQAVIYVSDAVPTGAGAARAGRGIHHQPGGSGRRRRDRTDPADRAGFNACGAPLPGDRVGHADSPRAGGADAGRLTTAGGSTMTPHTDSGIIDERSQHSVEQTVERLTAVLHAKG